MIKKKSISMIKWEPVCRLVVYRIIASIDQPLLLEYALVVGSLNFWMLKHRCVFFLTSFYVCRISGLDACQLVYWLKNIFQLLMFIYSFKFALNICYLLNTQIQRYVLNISLVLILFAVKILVSRYYQTVFQY